MFIAQSLEPQGRMQKTPSHFHICFLQAVRLLVAVEEPRGLRGRAAASQALDMFPQADFSRHAAWARHTFRDP